MAEIRFQDLFMWGMSRDVPRIAPFPSGPILNLGAGRKRLPFATTDLDLPDWRAEDGLPNMSDSVAGIVAFHFLEHLDGSTAAWVIAECNRVLMPGGSLLAVVPYYSSQLQAQNLDHRSAWCEETWRNLLSDETYEREYGRPMHLSIGFNMICGIVERNLCLVTQLIKQPED